MEVQFFHSERMSAQFVSAFIESLDVKMQKKIVRELEEIERYGQSALRAMGVKKIHAQEDFWELRLKTNRLTVRLFYIVDSGVLYIVHGFVKKSQKTPQKEIATAVERIRVLKNRLK